MTALCVCLNTVHLSPITQCSSQQKRFYVIFPAVAMCPSRTGEVVVDKNLCKGIFFFFVHSHVSYCIRGAN